MNLFTGLPTVFALKDGEFSDKFVGMLPQVSYGMRLKNRFRKETSCVIMHYNTLMNTDYFIRRSCSNFLFGV